MISLKVVAECSKILISLWRLPFQMPGNRAWLEFGQNCQEDASRKIDASSQAPGPYFSACAQPSCFMEKSIELLAERSRINRKYNTYQICKNGPSLISTRLSNVNSCRRPWSRPRCSCCNLVVNMEVLHRPRFKTPRVTRRGKYFKFYKYLPLVLLREGGKPQHDAWCIDI